MKVGSLADFNYKEYLESIFPLQREYLGEDKEVNKVEPMVSVVVITYQHADYIEECLDGVLMQKTDFPIEIVIGEDGSDDGTMDICKRYADKYQDRIRLFIRDREVSVVNINDSYNKYLNGDLALKSGRGKYIALCEGDDYWTDPNKLQKQVDFMEANPDYSMCFHNAAVIIEEGCSGKNPYRYFKIEDKDYVSNDIFKNWIVPLASVVFRREKFYIVGKEKVVFSDTVMFLIMASLGKVRGFSDVMSVYRRNSNSMTMKTKFDPAFYKRNIEHNYFIEAVFPDVDRRLIRKDISVMYLKIGEYYIRRLNPMALIYIYKAFVKDFRGLVSFLFGFLRLKLKYRC